MRETARKTYSSRQGNHVKRFPVYLFCIFAACKNSAFEPASDSAPQPSVSHPPVAVQDNMPAGDLTGRIEVAPAVANRIKAGDTIFIMARDHSTNAMVAVVKLTAPETFPLTFKLTAQNVMLPGAALRGPVKLSARVDKDGDALSKNAGDVVGEIAAPVQIPADGVVLTLSDVL